MIHNIQINLLPEDKKSLAPLGGGIFCFIFLFVLGSFIPLPGPSLFVTAFTPAKTSAFKALSPSPSLLLSTPKVSWRGPSLLHPFRGSSISYLPAKNSWFTPSAGGGFLPVITIRNSDVGSVDLIFIGTTQVRISVPAYSQRVFTLSPGWYEVELWPQIGWPLRGTALFLPYHQYRAETRVQTLPPGAMLRPFHLGD